MGWVPPEPSISVTLPDGRALAADVVGDPGGEPVVNLHGAPDCRLARGDDGVVAAAGVRLVAVDRPGYGASDPDPDGTHATFADDLVVLLDELDVARCRLLAWSAGGPWALAAAAALGPTRVGGVTTFACVAPLAALEDPEVRQASAARLALLEGEVDLELPAAPVDLDVALDLVEDGLVPRARRELAAVPGALDALARSLATAVDRHGDAGLRHDLALQRAPAELDLVLGARVPVRLVHGGADPVAGPAVGHWLAARLADATVEVWDGASHQALLSRWAELL